MSERRMLFGWALTGLLLTAAPAALAAETELPLKDQLQFIAAPLSGAGSAADASLSPDDVSTIVRVEDYLNRLDSVRSRFVQLSSDGGYAEGELVVDRPGMLRFEYDPPVPILMIADGAFLLYYDKELKQSTFLPLWETPLWFLVKDKIRLSDNIEVTDVTSDRATLSVTVRDNDLGDVGTITLVFSDQPLSLRKWTITDPQGITTQVALVNPQFGVPIDDKVFDYSDLDVYKRGNKGGR
jgi:outer membrane lipoprotein-sorting protein